MKRERPRLCVALLDHITLLGADPAKGLVCGLPGGCGPTRVRPPAPSPWTPRPRIIGRQLRISAGQELSAAGMCFASSGAGGTRCADCSTAFGADFGPTPCTLALTSPTRTGATSHPRRFEPTGVNGFSKRRLRRTTPREAPPPVHRPFLRTWRPCRRPAHPPLWATAPPAPHGPAHGPTCRARAGGAPC